MRGKRASGEKRWYVYALTERGVPRRFTVAGRALRAMNVGEVAVIVEPLRGARAASEQALREQHGIVVNLAGRVGAMLPVRFGASFAADELDSRVGSAHDVILAALDRVRGRVQMTVRIHSSAADPVAVPRLPSGTAYLAARRDRERTLRRDAARIRRAVSRFIVDERVEPGKGSLQGTVYHLIDDGDVSGYRAALEKFAAAAPLHVSVTGPWPVFAFVPELETR